MARRCTGLPLAGSVVLISCLTGCAVVDQYSNRAVEYNRQAEQAQQQALLLNIVRASLRRPMQFTTVQSVTGTANASGSAQLTVPWDLPFFIAQGPANVARPIVAGTAA